MASTPPPSFSTNWIPAKSWTHFVAGGLGGMCGAIVTSPFDVVKTRLQSNMFRHSLAHDRAPHHLATPRPHLATASSSSNTPSFRPRMPAGAHPAHTAAQVAHTSRNILWAFYDTALLIRSIHKYEGSAALFKGLGPTLVGVVPARSINFFTYGNGKQIIANKFNNGIEDTWVFLTAGALAGIVTSTATNPIWVVKTRLQLSASQSQPFTSSLACIRHILAHEGIPGLYKGLSASYLGCAESTIQWTLYENFKSSVRGRGGATEWLGMLGAAGAAKMIASLITYPHEVVRTRLRQPIENGRVKYRGLIQTFTVVIREEGVRSLYGGLSAHLLRVVPNAAVMYSIYEGLLAWYGVS
ncbi:mitochondrial carrier [Dacryopinax primogenitus]|uniref:Mitochondrial carrier n=1 Tax=Dacryopinax primogenitus (strain DJM 731) TaxID=1858805 RepID=M5FPU9_DACPD|nr:mitochondrial carrier [Dacryopinax primogenitus]EJT96599.1 mitochondrial carrier [Dacryopinax primogenitus]